MCVVGGGAFGIFVVVGVLGGGGGGMINSAITN